MCELNFNQLSKEFNLIIELMRIVLGEFRHEIQSINDILNLLIDLFGHRKPYGHVFNLSYAKIITESLNLSIK